MGELPSADDVGRAGSFLTTQAGITATVLAVCCIVLCVALWWREVKHEKERKEWLQRIETIRTEVWAAVENMLELNGDAIKALEERRRQDTNGHFAKLDDIVTEVKGMSLSDERHHSRVEAAVNGLKSSFDQMSQRLSDMITLASRLLPPPWDGRGDRRNKGGP